MTKQIEFEDLRTFAQEFESDTISLYVPRPSIEVHGEKWRILQKNILQQLEDYPAETGKLEAFVKELDLNDFIGQGKAVFLKGDTLKTADLNARPRALLAGPGKAIITPLIADIQLNAQGWIVDIDHEEAGLYYFDGQEMQDHSARLNAPDYEDVIARRNVQDDVFFHSASRGNLGQTKFHALGTTQQQEAEKTEEAFFRDVWNGVEHVIPAQTPRVYVVGAPGTVGRFAKFSPRDNWEVVQHRSGNGVEDIDLSALTGERPNIDDASLTVLPVLELRKAAEQGRISGLYLREGDDMLEHPDEGKADEHVKLTIVSKEGEAEDMDEVILNTLREGGNIHFISENDTDRPVPMVETRW